MGGTLTVAAGTDACPLEEGVPEEGCLVDGVGVMGADGEDDEAGMPEDVARAAICSMRAFQTLVIGALASSMYWGNVSGMVEMADDEERKEDDDEDDVVGTAPVIGPASVRRIFSR